MKEETKAIIIGIFAGSFLILELICGWLSDFFEEIAEWNALRAEKIGEYLIKKLNYTPHA